MISEFNPISANPEKWSNTLKQIVGNLPTICLSVFDHFMNLALKGLRKVKKIICLFTVISVYKSTFRIVKSQFNGFDMNCATRKCWDSSRVQIALFSF